MPAEALARFDRACEQGARLLQLSRALRSEGHPVHVFHIVVDSHAGQARDSDLYVTLAPAQEPDPNRMRAGLRSLASVVEAQAESGPHILTALAPGSGETVLGRPMVSALHDTDLRQGERQRCYPRLCSLADGRCLQSSGGWVSSMLSWLACPRRVSSWAPCNRPWTCACQSP